MTSRITTSAILCCTIATLSHGLPIGAEAQGTTSAQDGIPAPDGILVQVNERTVTEHDLRARLESRLRELDRENLAPSRLEAKRAEARREALRDLYEEALILARADELGYRVDTADVDREVVAVISTPDFQRRIAQESQADRDRVVARVHDDVVEKLTVQEVFRREVQPRAKLGEAEARNYYDTNPDEFRTPGRVRARAIVVKSLADRAEADLQRTADEIQAGVRAGRSLEDAAGPYIDVGIATEPVDLGWIGHGDVEPNLEAALWSVDVGRVIDPFPAEGGLHVVQVMERTEGRPIPFEEVESQLAARLRFASFSRALADYLLELEAKFQVRTAAAAPSRSDPAAELMKVTPVRPIEAAGQNRGSEEGPAGAAVGESVEESVEASFEGSVETSVEATVRAWAAAWSAQDADGYLAAYAHGFRPPGGLSRSAWEAQRRERLMRPSFIRIELIGLETEVEGERAVAHFRQTYTSDRFSDEVEKTLELVRESDAWRIVSERSP